MPENKNPLNGAAPELTFTPSLYLRLFILKNEETQGGGALGKRELATITATLWTRWSGIENIFRTLKAQWATWY